MNKFPASHETFRYGDRVQKKNGSLWRGHIVGWYKTDLTPEGYAVESAFETGSVQIYPVSALTFDVCRTIQFMNNELIIYEWEDTEGRRSDNKITVSISKHATIDIEIDHDPDKYGCGGSASIVLTKDKAKTLADNIMEWIK
jgi:dihydrofolate reductase (trimethoprim resistance protein)